MPTARASRPSHLSLFVTQPESGGPVARLPLYAEVAVPRIVPATPPNDRFIEPIRAAVLHVDPDITGADRDRVEKAANQTLVDLVEPDDVDALIMDPSRVRAVMIRLLKRALTLSHRDRLRDIKPSELKALLAQAMRDIAAEAGLALIQQPEDGGIIWSEPLGVLSTDHVGYASFDLRRLRSDVYDMLLAAIEARRTDPDAVPELAIWVYPYGHPGRFDALAQGRFADDAVVARLSVAGSPLPPSLLNMGPMALQNPSLTDWRLSPSSFAASPKLLVGESGCEDLVPANLALQEFVLRQVVRLVDQPQGMAIPAPYKPAYVDEYKVTWYSLGHSLGEILYSLPLAPGESVKLAVIDWSWDSLASRDEKTTLTENLMHQTHRDRTITETVKAGLKEMQHGSSFMGGVATSAGASGSYGPVGAAIGNAWSLGGSTATSEGSRDLTAENVQKLSDSFSQASSSQREINSTVVVQARQEEKESIQTRTFSNYNHSHTLTILYYEVLRHYRVAVEWIRRRQAVLVPRPSRTWTADIARKYRAILEPTVFDAKAKAGFEALEHLFQAGIDDAVNPKPAPPAIVQQRDWMITSYIFKIEVGEEETSDGVHIEARLTNGTTVPMLLDGNSNINKDELFNNDGTYPIPLTPQIPIRWGDLVGMDFYVSGDDDLDLPQIGIDGMGLFGMISLRDFGGPQLSFVDANKRQTLPIKPPGPDIPVPAPPPKGRQKISPEDNAAIDRLVEHLQTFSDYYERLLNQSRDPDTLAIELGAMPWAPGATVLDNVDPNMLESFGSSIAYPLARQTKLPDDMIADLSAAKSERLISLPTRGVFAEGKLGHCNVSEEIDNTRFWKWEEHPIPIEAPGINPATPISPTPQAVNPTPTAFPQSLVNIVNPSPAPDPAGLAAALSAISTPNIFRDMSGKQEVADLLKKLSDNTIAIADAANRAREIQAKYGSASAAVAPTGGGGTGGGGTGGGAAGAPHMPAPKPTPSQQQDQLQLWRNAADKGDITPAQEKEFAARYLQNASYTSDGGDLPIGYGTDSPAASELAGLGAAVVQVIQRLDSALSEIGATLPATTRARIEAIRQEAILMSGGNALTGEALSKALGEGFQTIDKSTADLRIQLAAPAIAAGVALTTAQAALLLAIAALAAILILINVSPEARAKARILKSKIIDLATDVVVGTTVEVDALRERVRRCREQPGPKSQACLDALAEFDKASAQFNKLRQDLMDAVKRVLDDLTTIADLQLIKALSEQITQLVASMHTLADTVRTACNCVFG